MPTTEVAPGIHWIGVNDRTTDLFEGLWPIADGVSYNSYLVKDKKTALIDLAKSTKSEEFISQIEEHCNITELDYIILNHMEPDHTGVVRLIRRCAPNATFIGTKKCLEMLEAYFGITENVQVVSDGDKLSLGDKELQFFEVPMVHWPETMVTFDESSGVLFACDAFGGYGALKGAIFDDEITDQDFYEKESLRYYANIVAKFSRPVLNAISKLEGAPVKIIAPSHGVIWRRNPTRIIELYHKWASYAKGPRERQITLLYGSMYGNTDQVMNCVTRGIAKAGVQVEIFDVARTHVSHILPALWKSEGILVGAPTYEIGLFPPMANVLDMAKRKRVTERKSGYFGSFGWSGGAEREFRAIAEEMKWEIVDELLFRGGPTSEDETKAEKFGYDFAMMIKRLKS